MKRFLQSKQVLIIIPIALILFIYFNQGNSLASDSANKEEYKEEEVVMVEKVPTRMDTMVHQYDSILTALHHDESTVGAAVVVTCDGEIVYLKCYGIKEAEGYDSIDKNTVFRLASVSKPVTGVLAGILANEQLINLDDRIIEFLPDFALKDSLSTGALSIRNILSHTSGLVPHAYDNLVEADVPFHVIMDSLRRVNISALPGILYGYQNVVFSLYDTIAAIKTGMTFEELLREKVFVPLKMDNASSGFTSFAENQNKAMPHGRINGSYRVLPLNDRYYNTNPAAGINASISDMGQFLTALTNHDHLLLPANVVDTVFNPQVVSPLRRIYLRRWGPVESKYYGLGWRIIGYKGRQIAYHGGYVRGYRAEIAVCREDGIGIAYLTNSPGKVGSEVVPIFLDMYMDE
ncbi:MAG: serine hydrolase domain-containing protein [Bacteroidales bacterium]